MMGVDKPTIWFCHIPICSVGIHRNGVPFRTDGFLLSILNISSMKFGKLNSTLVLQASVAMQRLANFGCVPLSVTSTE
jgi:hypothetical protein